MKFKESLKKRKKTVSYLEMIHDGYKGLFERADVL